MHKINICYIEIDIGPFSVSFSIRHFLLVCILLTISNKAFQIKSLHLYSINLLREAFVQVKYVSWLSYHVSGITMLKINKLYVCMNWCSSKCPYSFIHYDHMVKQVL